MKHDLRSYGNKSHQAETTDQGDLSKWLQSLRAQLGSEAVVKQYFDWVRLKKVPISD